MEEEIKRLQKLLKEKEEKAKQDKINYEKRIDMMKNKQQSNSLPSMEELQDDNLLFNKIDDYTISTKFDNEFQSLINKSD